MGVLPYCSVRLVQRGFKDGHNQLTRPEEQKKTKHDLQNAGVARCREQPPSFLRTIYLHYLILFEFKGKPMEPYSVGRTGIHFWTESHATGTRSLGTVSFCRIFCHLKSPASFHTTICITLPICLCTFQRLRQRPEHLALTRRQGIA